MGCRHCSRFGIGSYIKFVTMASRKRERPENVLRSLSYVPSLGIGLQSGFHRGLQGPAVAVVKGIVQKKDETHFQTDSDQLAAKLGECMWA